MTGLGLPDAIFGRTYLRSVVALYGTGREAQRITGLPRSTLYDLTAGRMRVGGLRFPALSSRSLSRIGEAWGGVVPSEKTRLLTLQGAITGPLEALETSLMRQLRRHPEQLRATLEWAERGRLAKRLSLEDWASGERYRKADVSDTEEVEWETTDEFGPEDIEAIPF